MFVEKKERKILAGASTLQQITWRLLLHFIRRRSFLCGLSFPYILVLFFSFSQNSPHCNAFLFRLLQPCCHFTNWHRTRTEEVFYLSSFHGPRLLTAVMSSTMFPSLPFFDILCTFTLHFFMRNLSGGSCINFFFYIKIVCKTMRIFLLDSVQRLFVSIS